MTVLMEQALERLRGVPEDRQNALARMVMMLTAAEEADTLTAEDIEFVALSRAAATRGEFATDEQMRAIWAKHGL